MLVTASATSMTFKEYTRTGVLVDSYTQRLTLVLPFAK